MERLIFHPDVKEEITSSYSWYQDQAEGLGEDFLSELEAAYQIIYEYPDFWPNFQHGFKRYLLARFPFSIIYRKHREQVYVVAIMHNRRRPGYWLVRA